MQTYLLKEAFSKLMQSVVYFIVGMLVLFVVEACFNFVIIGLQLAGLVDSNSLVLLVLFGLQFLTVVLLVTGFFKMAMKASVNAKPEFTDLFSSWRSLWKVVVAWILFGLLMMVIMIPINLFLAWLISSRGMLNMILFPLISLVPILFFMARWGFFIPIILEKDVGPIQALSESWNLTDGLYVPIGMFVFVLYVINIFGLLLFGFGLLFTIPLSFVAWSCYFRELMISTSSEYSEAYRQMQKMNGYAV